MSSKQISLPARALQVAVLLVLLLFTYSQCRSNPEKRVLMGYAETLSAPLEELAVRLADRRKVLVLVFKTEYDSDLGAPVEMMIRTLKRHGVKIQKVVGLEVNPDLGWRDLPGIPYSEFLRAIQSHPGADAVVSLCGPVYGPVPEDTPDPLQLPPFLLGRIFDLTSELEWFFESGHVALGVPALSMDGVPPGARNESLRVSARWREQFPSGNDAL